MSGFYQHRQAMVKNITNNGNILAIGVDAKDILMKLNKYFKLKPDFIHPLDDYLGTQIKKTFCPMEHRHGDKVVHIM
jgi:hypothetical protein